MTPKERLLFVPDSSRMPVAPPWPSNAPKAMPISAKPDDPFGEYDAVVITYTSAEAATLAVMFGMPTMDQWLPYRNNLDALLKLVTDKQSPILDDSKENQRYYHTPCLYMPCKIGGAKVLLMKSGFHPAYDGPELPLRAFVAQVCAQTKCKALITTGTAGGIGADTQLGDVNIASFVQFDATTQFKDQSWAHASYSCSPLPSGFTVPQDLIDFNASKLPGSPKLKVWGNGSVTTDCFAFDDSTDHYGLQNKGWRMCEMDDAPVAMAIHADGSGICQLFVVRNASDPQIPNPDNDIAAAKKQGEEIYQRDGGLTTSGSVVATWTILNSLVG